MNLKLSSDKNRIFASLISLILGISIILSVITVSFVAHATEDDKAELYDFEKGNAADYISTVQTNTWSQEKKYTAEITEDKFQSGQKSLHIKTLQGAATAQYFYFKQTFMPDAGKWYNLKVFVPEESGLTQVSLFYELTNGQIKRSDVYYFSQNPEEPVITDEIRARDTWVSLSFKIPTGSTINSCGIYLRSFNENNENADIYIDSYSITDKAVDEIRYPDMDNPAVRASFEGGTVSDYISVIQTNTWGQEKNYVSYLTDEHASSGKKSLCVTTSSGAAKSHFLFMPNSFFLPEAGKWVNMKIYVSSGKGPDYVSLFYQKSSGQIIRCESYYFADNPKEKVVTDEIRKQGEWVTLSYLIPDNAIATSFGVYFGTFGDSNDNCCFYLDEYSVTEKALDTIRYLDIDDPNVRSSFECGTAADYITAVQTNDWKQEKFYSANVTGEQAADGKKSLCITTSSGAAKSQFYFLNKFFFPGKGKWVNFKIYVYENKGPDMLRIFYQGKTGPILYSDYYYFAENPKEKVLTDVIRSKGQWVDISMYIPENADLNSFGITAGSFSDSNSDCKFYIDSFKVCDYATDTIRYNDINNPEIRKDFESGTCKEYITQMQTNDWKQESHYSSAVTSERKATGNKSLCISTSSGAAKSQYLFMPTNYFLPNPGEWVNIKTFVTEDKGPDYIRLFYKDASGPIKHSEYYYFADNKEQPVDTDEIRKKGEWITLSYLIPNNAKPLSFGVNFGSFGESNDNCCFYIDSYSVTDKALDDIRYQNMDDPNVKSSFESGTGADYINVIQTGKWQQEKCYTAVVSGDKAALGKKSLKISTFDGAAKSQYIFLNEFFKPQPQQWVNLKVFVEKDKGPDVLRFFYQGNGGPVKYSEPYYFSDNQSQRVMTDEIRKKGEWVTISMQIPSNFALRSFGLNMSSFGENNDNAIIFIDDYALSTSPYDKIRYGAAEPKGENLIDFESGSSNDYLYVVQNNKWREPSGSTSAVTSYRAADGKRSLYYKNDNKDDERILIYFPLKYNPPEGRFLNVKVFVEEDNSGLDYANLIFYKKTVKLLPVKNTILLPIMKER